MWKAIDGWPYEVSDCGRVRNKRNGYILKPCNDKDGYYLVSLCDRGKQVTRWIHRLVAAAFWGECPDGMMVNHKDGRKQNNNRNNLEYVTHAENERHAAIMGLKARGERSPRAKLTEDDVRAIRRRCELGYTKAQLGRMYGVSDVAICYIVSRRNWAHVR